MLWFADDRKLYRSGAEGIVKVLELDSQINEFAFQRGMLWLATSKGLEIFQLEGLKKVSFPYLQVMAGHAVEHIALDDTNRLWVSSGYQLYNVDIDKQSVRNFGSEWIVSQYLPAKVTRLYDTEDKLLLVRTTAFTNTMMNVFVSIVLGKIWRVARYSDSGGWLSVVCLFLWVV